MTPARLTPTLEEILRTFCFGDIQPQAIQTEWVACALNEIDALRLSLATKEQETLEKAIRIVANVPSDMESEAMRQRHDTLHELRSAFPEFQLHDGQPSQPFTRAQVEETMEHIYMKQSMVGPLGDAYKMLRAYAETLR